MTKCILNCKPTPRLREHEPEVHYGYPCEVSPEGEVIADIPEDLLQVELRTGRARLLEPVEP